MSYWMPWGSRVLLALLALGLGSGGVLAADDKPGDKAEGVFELGTVTVSAERANAGATSEAVIGQQEMARQQADTVSEAVRMLPGISLTRIGGRNEEMIYVRGFDSRQVPVYVDGIPLYVPYDGYVDFNRFTTFDLAEIRVSKSDASLLYGPNTLGGAINLVTRKPSKPFEGDIRAGFGSGQMRKAAVNLGGNQGLWYYQIGASYLEADSFRLPSGFRDQKSVPTDLGNYREQAAHRDQRLSFKLGLTPNASDEYAIGYVKQEGQKDQPMYTGASLQTKVRYWRWPYWDKDSLYFLSKTRIGENNLLKTRVYHDTYKNGLDMYTDASYTVHDPTSSYKDISKGASIEWTNFSLQNHELSFAAHYKVDEHDDTGKFYRDVTTSLVVQDQIALSDRWNLTLGLSHEKRDAKEVYFWPKGSTDATNALARLSYVYNAQGDELYGVVSHKTRFPTIKDRYSARMGRALPNPNLKPETANHFELGVNAQPWTGAQAQAAVFYSRVNDQIQTMVVPSDACDNGVTCDQAQNVGRTRNMGLELSIQQQLGAQWQLRTSYTYLHRTNLSDRNITLTETPRHRLFSAVQWSPSPNWDLRATLEAEQGRRVNYDNGTYRQLGGFAVVGLGAAYKPMKNMALEFGVSNLGDKWYEFDDGYPMPGRQWYVQGSYRF